MIDIMNGVIHLQRLTGRIFMTYVKQLIDNKERVNQWLSSSKFNNYEEEIHHLKAFL